jgi:hypothetical protein
MLHRIAPICLRIAFSLTLSYANASSAVSAEVPAPADSSVTSEVVTSAAPVVACPPKKSGPLATIEHMKQKCGFCGGGTGVYSESSYFCLGRLFVKEWQVGDERAGNPHSISCVARPSNGPCDDGYYVGGGCAHPCKAETRYCNEGVWGWDYVGHGCLPIVDLGYWHGRRDQTGNYKTEGPKIFHCCE